MSLQGDLEFRDANKITFIGGSSNTLIDLTTGSLGVGVTGTSLSSNLHVAGNKIKVGDNIFSTDGPHGRGVALLKKYPEIAFADGKFDSNDSTNTYVQAGYTVSASATNSDTTTKAWKAFNDTQFEGNGGWCTPSVYSTSSDGSATSSATEFPSGRRGEYIDLKLPKAIKVDYFIIKSRQGVGTATYIPEDAPGEGYLYGSDNGSIWVQIKEFTGLTYGGGAGMGQEMVQVGSTTFYKYLRLQGTKRSGQNSTDAFLAIGELEYYGYEEDPPAGDTSVDTTFKSIMNTPQTTGANVYVDAKLSSDFTNQVTGPTPVGTAATHDNTNKYWELTGELTSNVTLEANTFLEGDQPHAVSVWFNSSNLEANVSNTCVFSVSDQEKLDSVNLDLQSNTWHNLTYAYQGEGGSRVAYLDGRKVLEDQAEDTFGAYPPFAMTGYAQGGYVVSQSSVAPSSGREAWKAFDNDNTTHFEGNWNVVHYEANTGDVDGDQATTTSVDGSGTYEGEWIQIEFPHKIVTSYYELRNRANLGYRMPENAKLLGSNDDINWTTVYNHSDTGGVYTASGETRSFGVGSNRAYKYFRLVTNKLFTNTSSSTSDTPNIATWKIYGHRENDLVRLPDPTNVLKYPHIAMTGPAQRGYVASASAYNVVAGRPAWRAFDSLENAGTLWQLSGTNDVTTNGYDIIAPYNANNNSPTINDNNNNPHLGAWIKLQLPRAIKLSSMNITATTAERRPDSAILLGSNDDSVWYVIKDTFSLVNQNDNTIPVSTSSYYKYVMFLIKSLSGNDGQLNIHNIEYFGTEEGSVPIQIGGGNIDKVANFRVYDQFVGEDQALEIWDAQKDEFGRAKSSMTLQKGRLGLGTTEPQGRLAVADEPDPTTSPERVQEFPPKPLAGYKTHIEGHGVFCASASIQSNPSIYPAWDPFDGIIDVSSIWDSNSGFDQYRESDGVYMGNDITTTIDGGSISGTYIQLEMPYKVKLQSISIMPQKMSSSDTNFYGGARMPKTGSLVGSNDGTNWYLIASISKNEYYDGVFTAFQTASATFYSHFRLIAQTITVGANSTWRNRFNLSGFKLFGIREELPPKQSVLHDGQLTLTKNLTVPSIGPSVTDTRHAVPKRHKLVVEFDTSRDLRHHTDETIVRDTSGVGNDGVMYNGAYYDLTEKALKFDGTNDYIKSNLGNSGDTDFTISCWLNRDSVTTDPVWFLGSETQVSGAGNPGHGVGLQIGANADPRVFFFIYGGRELEWQNGSYNFMPGAWHHVVCTRTGIDLKLYLNGIKQTIPTDNSDPLQLLPNSDIWIGRRPSNASDFDGAISQFKLYDTVLTAGDVKTLYDMGRGDSYHVTNFQNTLVGINLGNSRAPRSALDVRDQIYARTNTIGTFTGQHICFPDESMEKGLIVSAKKNQFVKLNGLATGKSAITIDESLPIVSLSNVAQDKACFGVVSKMEESNTEYRTEITGGLVSESVKTLGDNRAIVNSVGEGAIWVVDTGGSLESGDYITTSNVAGYGQRQESEFLANYTVAKITMDCDFTASNVAVQTIKREQTGTRTITEDAWNQLVEYDRYSNVEDEITTYYQIQRGENVLDENGQLQFEDKTGATESPYERRFLTTDGTQTDEANAVHIAAFVGCTYHCG